MRRFWLFILLTSGACQPRSDADNGPLPDFVGQTPPDTMAQLFAPGLVSTEDGELNAVFSSDFQEFYFTRRGVPVIPPRIMVTRKTRDGWTLPEPVAFDDRFSAIDLFITPDGQNMLFCSNRPHEEREPSRSDHDFWMSTREGGGWGDPHLFAPAALSDAEDFYPILTASGNLYFNSQREGPGTNNIFRASQVGDTYGPAQRLPEPVNSEYREFDAFVSSAEDMIIFSSDRPGGYGRADLYITFLEDGRWSEPRNLGSSVNSESSEYGAMVSPDGGYLFFTSSRSGTEDIHWVSVEVLGLQRR